MYYDNSFCKHPRKVYNAARATIVYFLPYTDDVVESNCGPEWNFKIAANVAGMGDFGPSGCIMTEAGPAGRFGAILTDVNLVPDRDFGFANTESRGGTPEMFEVFKKYMTDSCYEGEISDELIAACPGKAIVKDGINRKKCQEYCKTIFEVELAAAALNCEGCRIAKSLTFKVVDKPIMIVVAGDAK